MNLTIVSGFYLFLFGRKILNISLWQKVQKNRVSKIATGTNSWPTTLISGACHQGAIVRIHSLQELENTRLLQKISGIS